MTEFHDPIQQVNYIQQSLSHDKKPIALLLSAGCPVSIKVEAGGTVSPLIPDINGLTDIVVKNLTESKLKEPFNALYSNFKEDGKKDPTVEDILSHIRALCEVVGKGKVRGVSAVELVSLDNNICELIVKTTDKELPDSGTAYHKLASWIGLITRSQPIEIFTTNYDLLMEQALEEKRIPYFDGFVGSKHPFFDTHSIEEESLPARWARLWKLHGSINWCNNGNGTVTRGSIIPGEKRHVIHPSHLKFDESRRMPYLAVFDRLRAFLKEPAAVLVTCGYSFRDDHLNEALIEGLQGNPTGIIFAMVHSKIEKYQKAEALAVERANFNLLAKDVAVIGGKKAAWIKRETADIDNYHKNAIEWVEVAGEKTKQANFKLGDFNRLGVLLSDLIGSHEIREK